MIRRMMPPPARQPCTAPGRLALRDIFARVLKMTLTNSYLPVVTRVGSAGGIMVRRSARQIANRLLELAREQGVSLTPMQLIKLVYLCHGWMLGLYGRPLFSDRVEAWTYGPVIRDLYRAVRDYRNTPVSNSLRSGQESSLDEIEDDIVRQTFAKYGRLSGPAPSRLTHAPGTPWSLTFDRGLGQNDVIENDVIERHFSELANAHSTK